MIYIEFEVEERNFKKGVFLTILSWIFPKANPDFENFLGRVTMWNLEFKDENSEPEREVGLDSTGVVIVKMPYKENMGYWTDNNMTLEGFKKQFQVTPINKEIFEKRWNTLL